MSGGRLDACSRSTPKVFVWDLATGTEQAGFQTPTKEPLYRAALSRDGKWLAVRGDASNAVAFTADDRLVAIPSINDYIGRLQRDSAAAGS